MKSEEFCDMNVLERRAREFFCSGDIRSALRIYLVMSDGDPSLDAGYLGMRIGECYEQLGERQAAKYWYGRAVEENPNVQEYVDARARLENTNIDDIIPRSEYSRRLSESDDK